MKKLMVISAVSLALLSTGCNGSSQESKDRQAVQRQQEQYAASQPVPAYDWSLERHLVIELYNIRNMKAGTHSVWRSEYGMIEGDCPSMGFGIPYDTSLTNPLQSVGNSTYALTSIEQAEPNGIFASKNTSATWVMCVNSAGVIEPVYVESKVTVYPYPVKIDYDKNRVQKSGKSTVSIRS
ncbi:hypothetical protein AB0539_004494 [Vibrio parahaemolyticus]|nr:hypothetical protein [Vibrio parahaemolyticus]